jgi:hypothetical protein
MSSSNPGEKKNPHAAELGRLGGLKGGHARRDALTPEQRRASAQAAALARWGDAGGPREMYVGTLHIEGVDGGIPCAVLEDERRVLATRAVTRAFGSSKTGTDAKSGTGRPQLPPFLDSDAIRPCIPEDLLAALSEPIAYRMKTGPIAYGYEAKLLPEICKVVLKARRLGRLKHNQTRIADAAAILLGAFAEVGITALVDEATGFQVVRARHDLQTILETYIAKELLPWTKQFPDAFFQQVYRLHGWPYRPSETKRPGYVGKFINYFVYEKLPAGVLGELRRRNPPDENGHRKHKHHQFLTSDVGHPSLRDHLIGVIAILRGARTPGEFRRSMDRAYPTQGTQIDLPIADA